MAPYSFLRTTKNKSTITKIPNMYFGICGLAGSGKEEAGKFFVEQGFTYISLSDYIREEARKRGLDTDRDTLVALGNELREAHGPSYLAEKALDQIKDRPIQKAVIVSIRNPAEVTWLRKLPGFMLLRIDAPVKARYSRIRGRSRDKGDHVTLDEFIEQDEREKSENPNWQQNHLVADSADVTISNYCPHSAFYNLLHNFLDEQENK